jgi:hypothetical protein
MTPIHALEATSLINIVYEAFQKIQDPRTFSGNSRIRLVDHLMSGLAIFGLKFPSLLNYDRSRKETAIEHNLKILYHVQTPPSDTYLRERLDEVDTKVLRKPFKKIFAKVQRNKSLEGFVFLDVTGVSDRCQACKFAN